MHDWLQCLAYIEDVTDAYCQLKSVVLMTESILKTLNSVSSANYLFDKL